MKRIHFLSLVLLGVLCVASSCSNDSFKIDGNLVNLEDSRLKVVFRGDSGVVDEWVNVDKKGHISYQGAASQPTLVSVCNRRGEPLVMMVAVNGDHLKLKGDAGVAMGIKVKGNRVNEEWQLFRDEHAAFYSDPNPSRLDAAIEKYVREHPTDMLSTLLLVADYSDYSDRAAVDKMLKSIDVKARPESLIAALSGTQSARKNRNLPRLMTLSLVKHGGDFEDIKLTDRVTLINMWGNPQNDRQSMNQRLGDLDERIHVLDVLTESDTLRWHNTIAGESRTHYWAPGGPLEPGIQLLGITTLPWYAVTDSTGLVSYSGPDFNTAVRVATSNLTH